MLKVLAGAYEGGDKNPEDPGRRGVYLARHQSATFIITLISNAFSRTAVFVEDSC